MPKSELPNLDETRCDGCGLCAEACPLECLQMSDGVPMMTVPGRCVGCGLCELLCRRRALELQEQYY
jgi:MinD superfamily P-loop ATPase